MCLLKYKQKAEWLLPKGRRNIGESRQAAAIREAQEETGYVCGLLPVRMSTWSPSPSDPADAVPGIKTHDGLREPFAVTVRQLDQGIAKFIWWYVAVIDEDVPNKPCEPDFDVELVAFDQAVERLSFENDREIMRKALHIVAETSG